MTQETNNLAADLWVLADLLRGDFKQSQYGRVILPFALLRRLECVLKTLRWRPSLQSCRGTPPTEAALNALSFAATNPVACPPCQ